MLAAFSLYDLRLWPVLRRSIILQLTKIPLVTRSRKATTAPTCANYPAKSHSITLLFSRPFLKGELRGKRADGERESEIKRGRGENPAKLGPNAMSEGLKPANPRTGDKSSRMHPPRWAERIGGPALQIGNDYVKPRLIGRDDAVSPSCVVGERYIDCNTEEGSKKVEWELERLFSFATVDPGGFPTEWVNEKFVEIVMFWLRAISRQCC